MGGGFIDGNIRAVEEETRDAYSQAFRKNERDGRLADEWQDGAVQACQLSAVQTSCTQRNRCQSVVH